MALVCAAAAEQAFQHHVITQDNLGAILHARANGSSMQHGLIVLMVFTFGDAFAGTGISYSKTDALTLDFLRNAMVQVTKAGWEQACRGN